MVFSKKRPQLNNSNIMLKRMNRLCQASPPKNFQRNKEARLIRIIVVKEKLKIKPQTSRAK